MNKKYKIDVIDSVGIIYHSEIRYCTEEEIKDFAKRWQGYGYKNKVKVYELVEVFVLE